MNSGYLVEGNGRLQCGLQADPRCVPGAALAAADVCVRALLRPWPAQGGDVLVRLELRPFVIAALSVPSVRVEFGRCRRPHGVQLALDAQGGISLSLRVLPGDAEVRRRRCLRRLVGDTDVPVCVIYTDGGYEDGTGLRAEGAGWGWVAVEGGDGDLDSEACEVARSCGPVDIDPDSPTYVGAEKLSNNTAEAQGLAEAMLWLAQSTVSRGSLVLLRPDSDVVVGWATGLTAVRTNEVLATALRQIYLQVSRHWRVRWSHVAGHSGHVWNDVADALAARGCRGETEGFACGLPHAPPTADPPPMVAPFARYVWHTIRAVQVSATPEGIEVSSSFVGRHRILPIDIELVAPGMFLPLRCPPTSDPAADLLAAVHRTAVACVGTEEVCHLRPQAIVFQAAGMDWDSARDWVEGLVRVGIGQPVEELCMPRGAGEWAQRVACIRCMQQAIVSTDVVEATGWVPPWERAAEAQDPGGVECEVGGEPGGAGGGQGAGQVDGEAGLRPAEEGFVDLGAGVGVWPLPYGTGVLSLDSGGGIRSVLSAPRPPSPVEPRTSRHGGPMVFWPHRAAPPTPLPASALSRSACVLDGGVPLCPPPMPVSVCAARTFAGWDDQGRELTSVPFPQHVVRPVPLRPSAVSPARPPPPVAVRTPSPLRSPIAPVPGEVAHSGLVEMLDDEVHHVRSLARRGVTVAGVASGCVRALHSARHWLASAAPRLLALPLPPCLHWAQRGDPHQPPD